MAASATIDEPKPASSAPGERGLPFLGEIKQMFTDPTYLPEKFRRHGHTFKARFLGYDFTVVVGAEANRQILTQDVDLVIAYGKAMNDLLDHTLFTQNGEEAMRDRRAVRPAFSKEALADMERQTRPLFESAFARWESKKRFKWFEELHEVAFEALLSQWVRPCSGASVAELRRIHEEWVKGFGAMIPVALPGTALRRAKLAREIFHEEVRKSIAANAGNPEQCPRIWQHRAEGTPVDPRVAERQSNLMVFAGNLTLTSFWTACGLALAEHPEARERIAAEAATLPADPATWTSAQIDKLTYLEAFVRELERRYPPVAMSLRTLKKDMVLNGYRFAAGEIVAYTPLLTHHDPKRWDEPLAFRPERHLPGGEDAGPYDLVAFARGPRRCLGAPFAYSTTKYLALRLATSFRWTVDPGQDLRMVTFPTLRPVDGLQVTFSAA